MRHLNKSSLLLHHHLPHAFDFCLDRQPKLSFSVTVFSDFTGTSLKPGGPGLGVELWNLSKNSLIIFGEMLVGDLENVQLKLWTLLKCVDDLLMTGDTYETDQNHHSQESFECKVSPHGAQILKQGMAYLVFQLKQGTRRLIADWKQAMATINIPGCQRQLCGFLGTAGFAKFGFQTLAL